MEARQWQDPPEYRGGGMHFAMPTITPVVKMLLIANIAVFLVMLIFVYSPTQGGGTIFGGINRYVGLSPAVWKSWFPFVPVWQLLTYGFLHAIPGFGHILGNMLFLYFLGTMLEGLIGGRRFLVFYLAAVVLAGFMQLLVGLIAGGPPIIGASGGVLAIVCAVATLRPQARIIFIIFPITLKTLAIVYVTIDVLMVILELKGANSNVASFAHLTGAALGYLAVRQGWIWRDPVASLERARERHAAESAANDRQKLDALLDRIHREGIGSLSAREKAFLKRMSQSR